MSEFVHLLKDRWFVSYQPRIKLDELKQKFDGDWNRAAESKTRRLDFVTSVEELWSTMNSLPPIQQLSIGSMYLFSRQDKESTYEAYPNGSRVTVQLLTLPASNKGADILLALILGESLPQSAGGCGGSEDNVEANTCTPVCDLVRLCKKQSGEYPNSVHVEVWLNDKTYSEVVVQAIHQTFKEERIPENAFSITTREFQFASPTSKSGQEAGCVESGTLQSKKIAT